MLSLWVTGEPVVEPTKRTPVLPMLKWLAVGVLSGGLVSGAAAQGMPCGTQEKVGEVLDRAGEAIVAMGISGDGKTAFQVWSSPDGTTWTITGMNFSGKTCVLGYGTDMEFYLGNIGTPS